jgi:hypothetical protein
MGLVIPRQTTCFKQVSSALVSNAEFGTSVTCGASAHTKTATPTQLIASTTYTAFGVFVGLGNVGTTASTNTRMLVDIMIGGSGSEQALIPNLMCGQAGASNSASSQPVYYYFPIIVPSGSRLSARAQSVTASDTVHIQVHLIQNQIPGRWYGTRVTDYGTSTADSRGTLHTANGSGSTYATTTQLTASSTNPIKALQVGIDLGTSTAGNTGRGVLRLAAGSSTNYIVSNLPYRESTTLENIDPTFANMILANMPFSIPAGSYLGVGAMQSTGSARGFAIYGVD